MGGLSNLKSKLLVEQTQEQIFQYILNTPLDIGTKLPNEFELGERFGVGRSTVREAVKLLVSRGILEVKQGSGTYVVGITPIDMDPLGLRAVEDKMALALDLVNVRMILEPGIAEMAALNATDEDIEKLTYLCDLVEQKIEYGDTYIQDDIAFHTCVAECSKNKVVEQLIPIIDTAVLMFVNVTHKKLTKETIMTHRAVVDAIAEHDPVGAKSAMTMHMTFNRNMIKQLMREENRADD
ncbi:MAG: FadR/GntR family transcriptional regulator [Eubacteriales bacterium]|nr:FadR/GntR family transcriptional regulator [Eubacteriales bacterium]